MSMFVTTDPLSAGMPVDPTALLNIRIFFPGRRAIGERSERTAERETIVSVPIPRQFLESRKVCAVIRSGSVPRREARLEPGAPRVCAEKCAP